MMNRRWLVGSLAACASIFVISGVVQASHSWGSYHWARTSNPFTLKLGDNMSASWDPYLLQTSRDWNSPPSTSPLLTAIVTGTAKGSCKAVAGTTQVCNGTYGNNG